MAETYWVRLLEQRLVHNNTGLFDAKVCLSIQSGVGDLEEGE
jgi:hypothetical protein